MPEEREDAATLRDVMADHDALAREFCRATGLTLAGGGTISVVRDDFDPDKLSVSWLDESSGVRRVTSAARIAGQEAAAVRVDDKTISVTRGDASYERFRKEYLAEWPPTERVAAMPPLTLADRSTLRADQSAALTRGLDRAGSSRLAFLLSRYVNRPYPWDTSLFAWDVDYVSDADAAFLARCGLQPVERRAFLQICRIEPKPVGLSDEQKRDLEQQWRSRFGDALKRHAEQRRAAYDSGSECALFALPQPVPRPCDVTIADPSAVAAADRPGPNRNGDAFGGSPLEAAFEAAVRYNGEAPSRVAAHAPAPPEGPDDARLDLPDRMRGGSIVNLPRGVDLPAAISGVCSDSACLLRSFHDARWLCVPASWTCKATGFGTSIFDESGAERVMVRAGDPELPDVVKVYDPNAPLFL